MSMKMIQKSRFKPKAFEFFRMVEQGESLVITDHGRPIAKIVPYSEGEDGAVGSLSGTIRAYRDPLLPIDEIEWEAGR